MSQMICWDDGPVIYLLAFHSLLRFCLIVLNDKSGSMIFTKITDAVMFQIETFCWGCVWSRWAKLR